MRWGASEARSLRAGRAAQAVVGEASSPVVVLRRSTHRREWERANRRERGERRPSPTTPALALDRSSRQSECSQYSCSYRELACAPPMAPLAAFVAHLAAIASSASPPPALFIHVPGDADHLARTVTTTLHRATADPRAATARDRPSVDALLPKVASLDLAHAHSTKAAFDSILDQLSAWTLLGDGPVKWDDRDKGIPAWHGSLDHLQVVRAASHRRNASGERPHKRARTIRRASSGSDDDGERPGGDDEPRWVLEWDADAPARPADKPSLAPLRNTVDAFHHSLRAIFAHSTSPPTLPSAASSALDPAADLAPRDGTADVGPTAPRRRFVVIEHGELLGELAGGAGGPSGAARETGVGVTFASTLHRLADLVRPLFLVLVSQGARRDGPDKEPAHADGLAHHGRHHLAVAVAQAARVDGRAAEPRAALGRRHDEYRCVPLPRLYGNFDLVADPRAILQKPSPSSPRASPHRPPLSRPRPTRSRTPSSSSSSARSLTSSGRRSAAPSPRSTSSPSCAPGCGRGGRR